MQNDWISATIKAREPVGYDSGRSLLLGPSGELLKDRSAYYQVREPEEENLPSSSRSFSVCTPDRSTLLISGNPIKLLQPHNCWGSCDLVGLYLTSGQFVRQHAGLFPSPGTWAAHGFLLDHFSRVDITRSYRFATREEAQSFIRHVAGQSRSRHGAPKLYGSETAVFGSGSRRWQLKVYHKGEELLYQERKKSPLNRAFRNLSKVDKLTLDWAQGVVRFELTLRTMELEKHGLEKFDGTEKEWENKLLNIWTEYYNKITWTGGKMKNKETEKTIENLPAAVQSTFLLWQNGYDQRSRLPRPTYYRHRRAIIEKCGQDISKAPSSEDPNNITARPLSEKDSGWDPDPINQPVLPDEGLKKAYRR